MQILEKIQTQYPDYMERVHINAVIDPTTDFDCTSNFFSDYKTVKDFYIQANLISEYYRKGNTLHNGIAGMCSYHFVLSGSARLFLCRVCKYSPGSSIYGYGKDCSETICAIAKCIKNRY